ncbi:hypothetical protein P43SY_008377 [Pythium insidiosum]|uniref:Uncharacterized protein n=1 Tax=Pythium insidiosum TaxID=114742 RepID=A0AAD5QBD6_PYTIN|nr:hypothetical protein P43SY_008377 [Pythium insidiosum]
MAGRKSAARWRDWHEWQDVHEGLFSDDVYAQRRAVAHVAAWRSRGDVPIAVNATAQLVEIGVHERLAGHHQHAIGATTRSHMEISLMYATAIVRCVNGLVDCSQKGTYAMAVSALAQRIGIPLWIVDLRHEATHNQLPSLSVLRFAADHLLAWLRTNYWFKQEDAIRGPVRRVAEALLPKLPAPAQLGLSPASTATATAADLKDVVDADAMRDMVVPLLVQGHQYGESVLPSGALFLPSYFPANDTAVDEERLLASYPRDALVQLVLELQALWSSTSGCLLAAISQHLVRRDAELSPWAKEAGLHWIKLLVSNEWRERIKYAERPIEEIYQAGAAVLAMAEQLKARAAASSSVVPRMHSILRACKGVRNHPDSARGVAMASELQAAGDGWRQLCAWPPSVLGQLPAAPSDGLAEYPLESDDVDANPHGFSVGADAGDVAAEDAALDELMRGIDEQYDAAVAATLALKQRLHEHVVHAGAGADQKVLPRQEVERIQSEIELW